MNTSSASQPIGIFDSGIGGLTVAQKIIHELPHEDIIYFGDTAHFPYGDKSASVIQQYTKEIVDVLLAKNCKMIVIACNSASASAYDALKKYVGDRSIIINIIDPVIEYLYQNFNKKTVGLIGTQRTINSKVYETKLNHLNANIQLKSLATPLLVSAIETMPYKNDIIDAIVKEYLSSETLDHIEALILGCTHYPVIEKNIADFYQHKLPIINPANAAATKVKEILSNKQLLNQNGHGLQHVYVSDFVESFKDALCKFYPGDIMIEHFNDDRSN